MPSHHNWSGRPKQSWGINSVPISVNCPQAVSMKPQGAARPVCYDSHCNTFFAGGQQLLQYWGRTYNPRPLIRQARLCDRSLNRKWLMPQVKVKENEPFDVALRRFKRSCEKAGVLAEVRKREHYEKPTTVRKRAAAAAVKRHLKKLTRENRKRQRLY